MDDKEQREILPDDVILSRADNLANRFGIIGEIKDLAHWIVQNKTYLQEKESKAKELDEQIEGKTVESANLDQQIGRQRITLKREKDNHDEKLRVDRGKAETERIDKRKQCDEEINDRKTTAEREVAVLRQRANEFEQKVSTRTAELRQLESSISRLKGEVGQLSTQR